MWKTVSSKIKKYDRILGAQDRLQSHSKICSFCKGSEWRPWWGDFDGETEFKKKVPHD